MSGSRRVTLMAENASVTPLELFFDLVFVYAFTQVTALMATDVSLKGVVVGLVVLTLVWWQWVGYCWLGNLARADGGLTRYVFLIVMSTMFVLALSVPESFADRSGGLDAPVVVVVCLVVVRLSHLLLFAAAGRGDPALLHQPAMWTPTLLGAVALLFAGALLGDPWQLPLWLSALVVDLGGTVAIGAKGWVVQSASHFSERHGLVVIIPLGESIVAIGVGVTDLPISIPVIVASTLGILLVGMLWWVYFDVTALVGEHRLATTTDREERAALARDAYSLLHLPLIAGIVIMALGLKKAFDYIGGEEGHSWRDPQSGLAAYVLPWGVALFLLGQVAFRHRIGDAVPLPCLLAVGILVFGGLVMTTLSSLVALAAVTAVMVALVLYEAVARRDHRREVRSAAQAHA
ncbi:low temperature requirement protein A [soil metagenome]